MNQNTDWISAIAILSAGLILGLMFVYLFSRRKTAGSAGDAERRDLEAKRDVLIAQLRELDDVSSKMTAEQAAEERTRLELETAQVLRELDQAGRSIPARPQAARAVHASAVNQQRRATMIGFAWGAGSMAALALLGYFVYQAAGPREDAAVQQAMQPQARPDAALIQLETAVKEQPENLDLRADLAQAYLERENLMGVFEQTQFVLAKSPDHSRALTYEALVRLAMGNAGDAVEMLKKATQKDPQLLDAWVALAWVRTQEGNQREAEKAMQEAMRRRPDEKERLQQVLAQMLSHRNVDMDQPAPQGAGGLPPGHPPVGDATPAPAVAPSAPTTPLPAGGVRITLDLDASARSRAARNGVIFVTARAAGVTAGPPIAAKRLVVQQLPVTFDLSAADSMMGQQLPPTMRLEARFDSDGNAQTRNPSDPQAAQDRVKAGSTIKMAMR